MERFPADGTQVPLDGRRKVDPLVDIEITTGPGTLDVHAVLVAPDEP